MIREDTFIAKTGNRVTIKRNKINLKPGAYSTIVGDFASHLNESLPTERRTMDMREKEQMAKALPRSLISYDAEQKANHLETVKYIKEYFVNISEENIKNWTCMRKEEKLYLLKMNVGEFGILYGSVNVIINEEKVLKFF